MKTLRMILAMLLALTMVVGLCGIASAEENPTFTVAIVRWTDGWGVDFTQTALLKEIGEAGGDRFYWNPEEHTITWFHRLSGESHIEVYALKDGELETITTADSYGPHHYPEKDNPDPLFFQDGEEISAGEIEALMDAYANDADEISYSK